MMKFLPLAGALLCVASIWLGAASAHSYDNSSSGMEMVGYSRGLQVGGADPPNCFPAIGFKMPSSVPSSLENWWCDTSTEYAFVGFSYAIPACQSLETLKSDFAVIRRANGRYVRIYGACDQAGFYNNVIEAAWSAGIGVHALIWFGFDGSAIYKSRRVALFNVLKSNPKARYVIRAVQFGSEPLFDHAIDPRELAKEVESAKASLSGLGIPVTVSEMAYGYQARGDGGLEVLKAIDFVDAHVLPFFSQQASTAGASWSIIQNDLKWFFDNANGKKIYLSQTGWPSGTGPGVGPNSKNAVADKPNKEDYFKLLDSHCKDFEGMPGGGVGWFAHLYSDSLYGIYANGKLDGIEFSPRTSC